MSNEKTEFQFLDQADREWRTWRQVCKQLEKRGINVNDPKNNDLMLAIKLWAEEQVELTSCTAGADELHVVAMTDLRKKYAPHVIDGWDV